MLGAQNLNWLFLDLNSYFAGLEQQLDPRLRGKPVAVSALKGSDASCAIAASYEAKSYGIKTGTPIRLAKRLCPSLIVVPARHGVYVDYHHQILNEIERHLPVTAVSSIDEAACQLRGRDQHPDQALALGKAIKAGIRARVGPAITCSVGIAPSRLLAKIATDLQKPDGLVTLMPNALPGPLLNLELTDLPGISTGVEKRLWKHRITTIEQFWHLGPKRARKVWGSVLGERFWRAFRGEDINIWEETADKRSISHSHMLPPHLRPTPKALGVLRRLTLKAAVRLRKGEYVTSRIWVSVRLENGGWWGQEIHIPPTDDSLAILGAIRQLWAALAPPDTLRFQKVGLALLGLTPRASSPYDLLTHDHSPNPQQQRERLWAHIDQLNTKYGRNTVVMGGCGDTLHKDIGNKIAFNRIPDNPTS